MNRLGCYAMLLLAGLSLGPFAVAGAAVSVKPEQRAAAHGNSQSYLGIDVRDVGDDQVSSLKLKDTRGAEIIRVDHDGPAGKMGLREHDVVLQMNGVTIDGEEQLRRMMHDCPPGKMVVMSIARDGQTITTSAPMADRSEIERQVWSQHLNVAASLPGPQAPDLALPSGDAAASGTTPSAPVPSSRYSKSFLGTLLTSPTYTGAILENMRPQLAQFFGVPTGSGLLVSSVADNSPAAMAGLKVGDVIVKADSKPIASMSHWAKIIREAKGKPVAVEVVRDRQQKTITLTPDVKHKSALELPDPPAEPIRVSCLTPL
jgi:serine protease Do